MLQTIDASRNILSSIDGNTFAPVSKSLRQLRLNANNINDIAPNSFAKLKVLEQIELQGNHLEHLKKDALTTSFTRYEGKILDAIADF